MTAENTPEFSRSRFCLNLPQDLKSQLDIIAANQLETTQKMIDVFIGLKLFADEKTINQQELRTKLFHQEQMDRYNFHLRDDQRAQIQQLSPNVTAYIVEAISEGIEIINEVAPNGEFILHIPLEVDGKEYVFIY